MGINVDRGYVPGLRNANGEIVVAQPNAGVVHRFTREGIAVFMYNDTPGVFYGEHGQEFPPEMAMAAGFDVEPLLQQRQKQEAIGKAQAEIEQTFKETKKHNVKAQRGSYKLVYIGNGMFNVEFEDGALMNPEPLSEDVALRVFDTLAPKKASPKPAA